MKTALTTCWLICAGSLTAQQTWVVDLLNRPGADFTDLPAAVAAASPGDTIELRPTGSVQIVYSAPTIQGKGLILRGGSIGEKPLIGGAVVIRAVPAGQTMIVRGVKLFYSFNPLVPTTTLRIESCRGPVVLDDVVGDGIRNYGILGGGVADCDLVTISRSRLEWVSYWPVDHSNLMISDSTIRAVADGGLFGAALNVSDSTVTLSRTALYGSSTVDSRWPYSDQPAMRTLRSVIKIGAGCFLAAGTNQDGSPGVFSAIASMSGSFNDTSTIVADFDEVRTRGGWSGETGLAYQIGPQTSLGFSMSATSLDVDQFVHAGALTVLAIGEPQTVPWTSAVGPVFVNPVGLFACFDFGVARMTLRRTLPIPPGLPVGTHVALQAFELLPDGTSLGSNVAIAGIW